jgi:flavin reductase (DIM6/NTAB) family NADH-FMN oxidoreductase RutF
MKTPEPDIRRLFIAGMRLVASSVSIIATDGEGERRGLTATAMSALAADPPLLLVCVNRRVAAHDLIRHSGRFSVNVLSDAQRDIASNFSGGRGVQGHDRFGIGSWQSLRTGAPILAGAVVNFDCELHQALEVATHTVFIGLVVAVRMDDRQTPLLYARTRYGTLSERSDAASPEEAQSQPAVGRGFWLVGDPL